MTLNEPQVTLYLSGDHFREAETPIPDTSVTFDPEGLIFVSATVLVLPSLKIIAYFQHLHEVVEQQKKTVNSYRPHR